MRQPAVAIVVYLLLLGTALAAEPDAEKSAAAVTALKQSLDKGWLTGLEETDFSTVPLTKADAALAREAIWKTHAEIIRKEREEEIKDRLLKDGKLEMPFFFKTFGKKPEGGRSLWISMHGGGGTTAKVNDQQYENQKKLYTVEEGLYLAPRAPTNTSSLWYEAHIDRLFNRLIEDLVVLEDVNPDRVYILGYSAGGDGVYQMAPRMADRWAAAAMMAGHPNGVSLLSLRNCPFALQVGGKDSAYNRNGVGKVYGEKLDALQKADPKGYEHFVKIHEGKGHWMNLEDRAALPWMAKFTRNPIPNKVVWKQTGITHDRFYWLAVPPNIASKNALITAEYQGQTVTILQTEQVSNLIVRLDDRMMDLDKPVTVNVGNRVAYTGTPSRTIGTLLRTLVGQGDRHLQFAAQVEIDLE
ncbi:hypothetical protein BH11PLA2_BH11PLA2_27510 [soil metagenome]